ncbi:MAG TPA: hypothetical protein VM888_05735 [Chitinophagaceae bacterium]|jgi:hypothetical protein|nr:hypothetical protein [Chitinophagaceae bacterium]
MTRLFSLNFTFNDKECLALVSLRQQSNELYCMVRYVNKDLQHLASGDKLVFGLDGNLKQPNHLPDELNNCLTKCTAEAISNYLKIAKT